VRRLMSMVVNIASNRVFEGIVSFADTDAGGVVYHGRYLEMAERGRIAWLMGHGFSNQALMERGIVFAVRHLDIQYKQPLKLGDSYRVITILNEQRGASVTLNQHIERGTAVCALLTVDLGCITLGGKPTRIPDWLTIQET
jgi:acyl-CoA thioester hydrolase